MGIKEVRSEPTMAEFEYLSLGPAMKHNYYCSVCREKIAVVDMSTGILQPCWTCQDIGYILIKMHWLQRLIQRIKGR